MYGVWGTTRTKQSHENIAREVRCAWKRLGRNTSRKRKNWKAMNKTETIVCFDLMIVLTCPWANVQFIFYKKKIKVYNLTTHCSLNRKAYTAIWTEHIADRGASALLVILSAILKDQTSINTIIRWFDSCIPHNRISVMTLVLKMFISRNPYTIKEEQTFWTPGHPFIQDADNIHSHLDVGIRIYTILSLATSV